MLQIVIVVLFNSYSTNLFSDSDIQHNVEEIFFLNIRTFKEFTVSFYRYTVQVREFSSITI